MAEKEIKKTIEPKTVSVKKTKEEVKTNTVKAVPEIAVKPESKVKIKGNTVKSEKSADMIRVTMIHGLGSCTKRQVATAKALRLARPGDVRDLQNLPSVLGMCKKLEHLVKVEKADGGAK
jgi:ribosomal protein L30/L7E